MLHIILGILKLIGIILAAFLILLLGLVVAVMFVPLRYKATITKTQEEMGIRVGITWLLHFVSVFFTYDPVLHQRIFTVRFCGISLDRIKKFCRARAERKRKRKERKRLRRARKLTGEDLISEDPISEESEEEKRVEEEPIGEEPEEEMLVEEEPIGEEPEEEVLIKEELISEESEEMLIEEALISEDSESEKTASNKDIFIASESSDESGLGEEEAGENQPDETDSESENAGEGSSSIYSKLKVWFSGMTEKWFHVLQWMRKMMQWLCSIPQRVKRAVAAIIDLVKKILQMPEKAAEKIAEYQKLWQQYEGSEVLGAVKKECVHLIKCFRPRKISGYLHVGTGDPAQTGQLLGLLYLLLPARARKFELQPEFTEIVFETELSMSGHIRLNHAMASGWRLLRNKKLMRAIKMLKKERRK